MFIRNELFYMIIPLQLCMDKTIHGYLKTVSESIDATDYDLISKHEYTDKFRNFYAITISIRDTFLEESDFSALAYSFIVMTFHRCKLTCLDGQLRF